jgi:diaminopimelate decarboxylase/aspartate kinase
MLRRLEYDEAQELATTGAKVLHPRCLAPCRDAGIPLHIRCTQAPHLTGTLIDRGDPNRGPAVVSISQRTDIVLVSMETVGMWQQVGFLADVFGVFRQQGLSVDSVSTSETNVTVTLDPAANPVDRTTLVALERALSPYCQATAVPGCASVSLVGRGIRAILHQLAPALQLFEEHRVHLVTQAASDLNLTVVVDATQADRLVDRLHALLFAHLGEEHGLGPTWSELFEARQSMALGAAPWWHARKADLQALRQQTPLYVYDGATVRTQARQLKGLAALDRVLFAMKANPHPEVLRLLHAEGIGFETVSRGEVSKVLREVAGIKPKEILFTPNFCRRETVSWALDKGVLLTLDNLHPIERWPELFDGAQVFLRLDPGKGRGHHDKVRTAGSGSKFGISIEQLDKARLLVEAAGATVVGLHAHAGSGVLDISSWEDTALWLADIAATFPEVRVLDLGGGLGIPSRPGAKGLDLAALDRALLAVKAVHPQLQLWMEPGRYLVAEAGVLLLRVTQTKQKATQHYVGVDAGMNALIRPALYGSWHPIDNLDRMDEAADLVADVVGPICESGDVLGRDRRLPSTTDEGDVLLVANAGAYGASMASTYNDRPLPAELLLD